MIISDYNYEELIRLTTTKFGEKVLLAFKHPYLLKLSFDNFISVLKDKGVEYKAMLAERKIVIDGSEFHYKSFEDIDETDKIRGMRFSSVIVHELSNDVQGMLANTTGTRK